MFSKANVHAGRVIELILLIYTNHSNICLVGPVLHLAEDPSCTQVQADIDQSTMSIYGCGYSFLGPNRCRNLC